jgi:hypothetical protein
MTPAEAGIPAAALAREAAASAAMAADEDKGVGGGTCSCGRKGTAAVVTKARGHRDYNSGEPEPAPPVGRAPVPDPNPTAVPSSSAARSIRDGGEATAAHQALVADQAHATASGGSGGVDLGDRQLAVSSREATSGLSAHLQGLDAGRLAIQANGGGHLKGGKK